MEREIISFDNAMKGLLHEDGYFGILNGFLSELIQKQVEVQKVLYIDDNRSDPDNLYGDLNRLDLKAKIDDEVAVFEIQYFDWFDYMRMVIFNSCKAIVETIASGGELFNVKKVYSINIATYYNFDVANDYLFVANSTEFKGVHFGYTIPFFKKFKPPSNVPKNISMEYFLIIPQNFNEKVKTKFDEWVYVLKNSAIKSEFTAAGIQEAGYDLDAVKTAFRQKLIDLSHKNYVFTAELKGRKHGRIDEKEDAVIRGHNKGHSIDTIAEFTDLTTEQILKILKENGLQ